jgi:hypothetical protein
MSSDFIGIKLSDDGATDNGTMRNKVREVRR